MIKEHIYSKAYTALKNYHNSIKNSAIEDYVPQFCIDQLIMELDKIGLQITEKEKENL